MSKNSARQRYTQLHEWLKTIKTTTRKTVKQADDKPLRGIDMMNMKIKNGPSGRR